MSELRKLFNAHKCDKGYKHGYEKVYEPHFEPRRNDPINILEVGCFRGESINTWVDYFPNATVYTIDIFERVSENDIPVLQNDRVKWIKHSSMDPALVDVIKKQWGKNIQFDFIIDDGAHWPKANTDTFKNLFPFLKKDGAYFVEDVWNLDDFYKTRSSWVLNRSQIFGTKDWNEFKQVVGEYETKHYDLTVRSQKDDSYIVKVTHG